MTASRDDSHPKEERKLAELKAARARLPLAVDYTFRVPAGPLGDFVSRFWHLSDTPLHRQERIVPSGTLEMVFNLHENGFRIHDAEQPQRFQRFSGAIISGTYTGPFIIDARQHTSVLGVHFQPGGAFPFLGPAVSELAGRHFDLEELWGPAAIELRDRLCAAHQPGERFRLVQQALLAHLFRPMEHHYAVRLALSLFCSPDPGLSVREVVRRAGLSQRRFIQLFAREVGLAPKQFCRVRRFQQTLGRLRQTVTPDWAQLVSDCGYFDQSHLIREFRDFCGLQPGQYLRDQNYRVKENHVPLPALVNFVQYNAG